MPHFRELDGIRGLAAVGIFFHHFFPGVAHAANPTALERATRWVFSWGYLSVDVFFVLSGFLITSILLHDRGDPHYFNNFYWKRILRIQPVFLIFVAIYAYTVPHSGRYVVLCLLFLANFSGKFHVYLSSVLWSLCIEEQFYLGWPQFVRRLSSNKVAWSAVTLIVVSAGLRIGMPLVSGHADMSSTYYRLDGLGLGALIACNRFASEHLSPTIRQIAAMLRSRVALVVMLVGCTLTLRAPVHLREPLAILLTGLLTYQLISAVAWGRSIPWLRSRPLTLMGGLSYSFYLYHVCILSPYQARYPNVSFGRPVGLLLSFVVIFGGTVLASTASLFLVERPAQRLRRFVLKRPVPAEIDPPPLYVEGSVS